MTTGKIIAIIFGMFFLITSIGLITGGGAIIAVNETLTDNDGYFNTPSVSKTPAENIIALRVDLGNIDFGEDQDFRVNYVDPGSFVTFKVSLDNLDDTYFAGITSKSNADAYLAGLPYLEVTNFDFEIRRGNLIGTIVYTPFNPTSNTTLASNLPDSQPTGFWKASNDGTATEFTWAPEAGEFTLIFMRSDGTGNLDLSISIGARVPILGAVGGFLLVFGFIMLFTSIIFFYIGFRSTRRFASPQQVRVYSYQPPVQAQSGSLLCSNCGSELEKDAKFCAECGEKVVGQVEADEAGIPAPKVSGADIRPVTTNVTMATTTMGETFVIAASWTRFWAYLIDIILVNIFVEFLRGILIIITGSYGLAFGFGGFNSLLNIGPNAVALFLYWVLTEYYWNGQSIGKSALNLVVIREDGSKPEIVDVAVSAVGKAFILPIDLLIGYFTNNPGPGRARLNQRLFQKLSKTLVVTRPTMSSSQIVFVPKR